MHQVPSVGSHVFRLQHSCATLEYAQDSISTSHDMHANMSDSVMLAISIVSVKKMQLHKKLTNISLLGIAYSNKKFNKIENLYCVEFSS